MALYKLEDFNPNYRDALGGVDIKGFDVYTEGTDNKIGTVTNALLDEEGNFRYLVIEIGFWLFGKKVLLPVGRSQINENARRFYVSLTKEQAQALPEFNDSMTADYDYEEQVRGVYRTPAPMSGSTSDRASAATYDRDTYTYQQDASLYEMNDTEHQTLKLYAERLIANKKRMKTGEVAIGKRVETETARASVPIEKERVVIERTTPADAGTVVAPGDVAFTEGQVARMEVYEETPDIHKEAFVREEVKIRKEVDRDTVDAEETLRREELDIDTQGRPVVDSGSDPL